MTNEDKRIVDLCFVVYRSSWLVLLLSALTIDTNRVLSVTSEGNLLQAVSLPS